MTRLSACSCAASLSVSKQLKAKSAFLSRHLSLKAAKKAATLAPVAELGTKKATGTPLFRWSYTIKV